MIRVFVSGLIIAVTGLALFAASLNTLMYGLDAETVQVGAAYAVFLALAVWSARGSGRGTAVLAVALLVAAVFLVVATVPTRPLNPGWSRWRIPGLLVVLSASLFFHRRFSHADRQAAEQ